MNTEKTITCLYSDYRFEGERTACYWTKQQFEKLEKMDNGFAMLGVVAIMRVKSNNITMNIQTDLDYQMAQNELRALMANPGINAQRIIELQQAIDAWLRR